jgi:hypothetical protein
MKTFTNTEYGIESQVTPHSKGFAVALRDTDADAYLGEVRIYKTEDDAITYAQKLVA